MKHVNGVKKMIVSPIIDDLGINTFHLDEKSQQTDYKIKYVTEYVRRWLQVSVNRDDIRNINFMDCMSNAGIYKDGEFGTPIIVFQLFIDNARQNPSINFNLFINDNDKSRVEICKKVMDFLCQDKPKNLSIFCANSDVNDYLEGFSQFDRYFRSKPSSLVFIDPYNAGTVRLTRISSFLKRYYCEVIFNFFTSDVVRNGVNNKIRECIGDSDIKSKDDLLRYLISNLKVGFIKFSFSYQFRTSTNTEIYQIVFFTPHTKGLEKLKEALWQTFNGRFYHRNHSEDQLQLITDEEEQSLLIELHSKFAKESLSRRFSGQSKKYSEISAYLIENTMLKESDFLRHVIKPLMIEGLIRKRNITGNPNNYKGDDYFIEGESNERD